MEWRAGTDGQIDRRLAIHVGRSAGVGLDVLNQSGDSIEVALAKQLVNRLIALAVHKLQSILVICMTTPHIRSIFGR